MVILCRLGYFIPLVFGLLISQASCECVIPSHLRGEFFSIERGTDVKTLIDDESLTNLYFTGSCAERNDDNSTIDANGAFDSKILFYSGVSGCYKCYNMLHQTPNIIQYQESECRSYSKDVIPTLQQVCSDIQEHTAIITLFRIEIETVNCKNTFEGIFQFTYEVDVGRGAVCVSPDSVITACQEPGSPYVDNEVFFMEFGRCPEVSYAQPQSLKMQCMGSWNDEYGNVWSAVADLGEDILRFRFRCMLTRYDQEVENNKFRYTMSHWAECSILKSPYEGPIRLELWPVIGGYQLVYSKSSCNFPADYIGTWYYRDEYESDVIINMTHIYIKTRLDQYLFRESYYSCVMMASGRYLVMAVTVGKCELDYACFDFMPRHQNIIRWRLGKPYRLSTNELAMVENDRNVYMLRQACSYISFTLDRSDIHWRYKAFILNPPQPVPCPVRGRFSFIQKGPDSELYRTRIRDGMTERPRHRISCRKYSSLLYCCDKDPAKFMIDAEYCETLDHTGQPIGEYDEPDWIMTCAGQWDENWDSFLITWDREDPTSPFRCWNYERIDWLNVIMSRATGPVCPWNHFSSSSDPSEGASLHLTMTNEERLYDDCSITYIEGDPYTYDSFNYNGVAFEPGSASVTSASIAVFIACAMISIGL